MSKTFTAIGGILWLASGGLALVVCLALSRATFEYNYAIRGAGCQIIAVAEDSVIVKCDN